MGVLSVGVRSASSDLVSFVHSDTSLMLDIAPNDEETLDDPAAELAEALGRLSEHSPLLRGLALALDQSERRVRELLGSMATVVARVETSNHAASSLVQHLQEQAQTQEKTLQALHQMQSSQNQLSESQSQMVDASQLMVQQVVQQNQFLQTAFFEQNQRLSAQSNELQEIWRNQAMHQQHMLEVQQNNWQVQMQTDNQTRQAEWTHWAQIQQSGLQQMVAHLHGTQLLVKQMAEQVQRNMLNEIDNQAQQAVQQKKLFNAIEQVGVYTQGQAQTRAELLNRLDALLTENKFRNEQMVHLLDQRSSRPSSFNT